MQSWGETVLVLIVAEAVEESFKAAVGGIHGTEPTAADANVERRTFGYVERSRKSVS